MMTDENDFVRFDCINKNSISNIAVTFTCDFE